MTVARTLTGLTVDVWENPDGYVVTVRSRITESSIGSGKITYETETYEKLTIEEARDVLEAVSTGLLPGMDYGVAMSLFTLV